MAEVFNSHRYGKSGVFTIGYEGSTMNKTSRSGWMSIIQYRHTRYGTKVDLRKSHRQYTKQSNIWKERNFGVWKIIQPNIIWE
jgi:hypothetical protein